MTTSVTNPFPTGTFETPYGVVVDNAGKYMYNANKGTGYIYQITLSNFAVNTTWYNCSNTDIAFLCIDSNNTYLYVLHLDEGAGIVQIAISSDDGQAGTANSLFTDIQYNNKNGMALYGTYLYVSNNSTSIIYQLNIDSLASNLNWASVPGVTGIVISSDGLYMYCCSTSGPNFRIVQISIGSPQTPVVVYSTTNRLCLNAPFAIAINALNTILYVTNLALSSSGSYVPNASFISKITIATWQLIAYASGLNIPKGISIDNNNNLIYVTNFKTNLVNSISPAPAPAPAPALSMSLKVQPAKIQLSRTMRGFAENFGLISHHHKINKDHINSLIAIKNKHK